MIVLACIGLFWGVVSLSSNSAQAAKKEALDSMAVTVVIVFFIFVGTLNRSAMLMLQCERLGSSNKWVSSLDMDLECMQGEHSSWAFSLSIPSLLLFSLLIPVLTVVRMQKLNKQGKLFSGTHNPFIFLYAGFREPAYLWEVIILARKILLNMVLLSTSAIVGSLLCLIIFQVSSSIQHLVQPYKDRAVNIGEGVMLGCTSLTLFAGLFLFSGDNVMFITVIISLIIVASAILMILVFVVTVLQSLSRKSKFKQIASSALEWACFRYITRILDGATPTSDVVATSEAEIAGEPGNSPSELSLEMQHFRALRAESTHNPFDHVNPSWGSTRSVMSTGRRKHDVEDI